MIKKIMIILLFPIVALGADEAFLRVDGEVRFEVGWAIGECDDHVVCVSDDDDVTQIFNFDNSNETDVCFYTIEDASIADSTIDSINYVMRWSVTNTANSIAIIDSVGGQTAGLRTSSTLTNPSTETIFEDTVTYTSPPDGGAYTWADIDANNMGVAGVNVNNNQQIDVWELWISVYYHFATAPTGGQVIMITGSD